MPVVQEKAIRAAVHMIKLTREQEIAAYVSLSSDILENISNNSDRSVDRPD